MSLSLEEITKLRKEKKESIRAFFISFIASFVMIVLAIITELDFGLRIFLTAGGGFMFSLGAKALCEAIVSSCRLGPFVEE